MDNRAWSWGFVWIRIEFLCCFWMLFHSWTCALLMCRQRRKLKIPWTWGTDLQGLRCSLFIVAIHFIYIWPHSGPQGRFVFCVNGGMKILSEVVGLLTVVLVWNSFYGALETIGAKTIKRVWRQRSWSSFSIGCLGLDHVFTLLQERIQYGYSSVTVWRQLASLYSS